MKLKTDRDRYLEGAKKRAEGIVAWYGFAGQIARELTDYMVAFAGAGWDEGYRAGDRTRQNELPF